MFITSTTRIATNADSLVGRCASASSRRKFKAGAAGANLKPTGHNADCSSVLSVGVHLA